PNVAKPRRAYAPTLAETDRVVRISTSHRPLMARAAIVNGKPLLFSGSMPMILQPLERRSDRRAAFTLMEVLVVAVILVILAWTASIAIFNYLDGAKKDRARLDCNALKTAVMRGVVENQKRGLEPPASLQDVVQYLEG